METRKQRAREQFPQVLLAVLGIIQALALELLWERGVAGLPRWEAVGAPTSGLLQVLAVFLGVVVIWVIFATMVLRFRWLPRFRDLVSPFVLGALEFLLIEWMAPADLARWFALLAFIFVAAAATTFLTFHAALAEDELGGRPLRHQVASYVPSGVVIVGLLLCTAAVAWRGPASATSFVALLLANLGLATQLLVVRLYWYRDLEGD